MPTAIPIRFSRSLREEPPAPSTGGEPTGRPAAKRRILAVDDQQDVLDLLRIVLSEEGFSVDAALGGREALERVAGAAPDLILLDLVMPQVDGWEVLRSLARMQDAPPAIVLTARRDSAAFVEAFQEGATGYVVKPFELDELVATCNVALAQRPRDLGRIPERRAVVRRPFFVQIRVRTNGRSDPGSLTELSPHGARISADAPLRPGDVVSVDAELSRGSVPVGVQASVVWRGRGAQQSIFGLRLHLDDAQTAANVQALFPDASTR